MKLKNKTYINVYLITFSILQTLNLSTIVRIR